MRSGLKTQFSQGAEARLIERLSALAPLTSSQAQELAQCVSLHKWGRRQIIRDAGDSGLPGVYVLVSGHAKVSYLDRDEQEVLSAILAPGEFFSVAALLPGRGRQFSYLTLTDCLVGRFATEEFVRIIFGVPLAAVQKALDLTLGHWVERLVMRSSLMRLSLRQRLLMVLHDLVEKFGVRDSRGMIIDLPITRLDLAAMVGASRTKVSEHLSELERQGVVLRDRRRLIVRMGKTSPRDL